jgi:hypothetical protein
MQQFCLLNSDLFTPFCRAFYTYDYIFTTLFTILCSAMTIQRNSHFTKLFFAYLTLQFKITTILSRVHLGAWPEVLSSLLNLGVLSGLRCLTVLMPVKAKPQKLVLHNHNHHHHLVICYIPYVIP